MNKGSLARYNLMRVEIETFTYSDGSNSKSVLGAIQKRLIFTMVKNADFIGSLDSNPYKFQLYDIRDISRFVNTKQFPNEGLYLGIDHEKIPSWATGRFSRRLSYITRTRDCR